MKKLKGVQKAQTLAQAWKAYKEQVETSGQRAG